VSLAAPEQGKESRQHRRRAKPVEIPVASRDVEAGKGKGRRPCTPANGVASGNATGEQGLGGGRHRIAMEMAMELSVAGRGRAGGW
jgi:hypothetical protein